MLSYNLFICKANFGILFFLWLFKHLFNAIQAEVFHCFHS